MFIYCIGCVKKSTVQQNNQTKFAELFQKHINLQSLYANFGVFE